MPAGSYWIKPAGQTYAPRYIVSVIPEMELLDRSTVTGEIVYGLKRLHISQSERPGIKWTGTLYKSFDDGEQLLDWLESTGSKRRRTYLFAPSAMDCLTVMNFQERITKHGCKLIELSDLSNSSMGFGRASESTGQDAVPWYMVRSQNLPTTYSISAFVPGSNANIVRYLKNQRTFQWCSHVQYCTSSEDSIARQISYQWLDEQDNINQAPNQHHSHIDRCFLWLKFYQYLSDWWYNIDGGPWGATTAAMAYNFLRKRVDKKSILRHNNERVGELEENAIFAGRRSVWYLGNIGRESKWEAYGNAAPQRSELGSIDRDMVHHDVRSMYPYLLSCMPYPVRLMDHIGECSCDELIGAMERYGAIAYVLIDTDKPEFPLRTSKGISYPIGSFYTTLCGAELSDALSCGYVKRVINCALYVMGTPFKEACSDLLDMRQIARDKRQDMWGLFIKMLSNSMSGKIAQIPYHWKPLRDYSGGYDWGQWWELDNNGVGTRYLKAYASMTWERVKTERKNRAMGASYAYLTSYGRWLMQGIRTIASHENVIAQDTDGIWTFDSANKLLYPDGVNDRTFGGDLYWKLLTPVGRFYGPQHYWYGSGWIISGANVVAHRPKSNRIVVRDRKQVIANSREMPEPYVHEVVYEKTIGRINVPGEVDHRGWVIPQVLHCAG